MKKIKTGMDYHTSRLERRSCGCEIVIDITVTKLSGVSLFPSINYCELHGQLWANAKTDLKIDEL